MTDPAIGAHAPQLLHAMVAVADLERSLGFYVALLGMREIRRIAVPERALTMVFLGYADAPAGAMQLELWHEAGAPVAAPAAHASHVGIGVRDLPGCVAALAARGVRVLRAPGPMRPGGRAIAIVVDPDGHEVELLASD
jgi:lactoylglutathione lyase